MTIPRLTRRQFLQSSSVLAAGAFTLGGKPLALSATRTPLEEFAYGDIAITSDLHNRQFENTHSVLMGLDDDALMKPFRSMAGQPAPGEDLGGWYRYDPNYNPNDVGDGFAPGASFGQWISALARGYAMHGDPKVREKVLRLNQLYAKTISPEFYGLKNRFPAYCYDKLVCGLIDSHQYVGDPDAFRILDETTNTATPLLPGHAIEHDQVWRSVTDPGYTWDESYTISENLFLAYQRGAGKRYRDLGAQYLDDIYYDPLAEGRSDLAGRHAYSHVNSLCSAMQAWLTIGSEKHLRAAKNGFGFLRAQSYATGGWGPDELLRAPNSPDLAASVSETHHSFETPCGSYAHFKLSRYLLRVTRDSQYGDSMERVMYNTILGAKALQPDGRTFYYSDYNFKGSKFYHNARWPCCSGTMPQIATDYGISSYLHDPEGIYVNLYIPSRVQWKYEGAQIALTQTSEYPFESSIEFQVSTSRPEHFSINLRIPAWAEHATVAVNGKRVSTDVVPGSFATVHRRWKDGDRVELELPMRNRLEPISPQRSDLVALLYGPMVLFAINAPEQPFTAGRLLSARKIAKRTWQADLASGAIMLLPFTEISDEPYSTYLKLQA